MIARNVIKGGYFAEFFDKFDGGLFARLAIEMNYIAGENYYVGSKLFDKRNQPAVAPAETLGMQIGQMDYFYIALQSMIGQTRQRGYSRHFQFLKVLHIPIPPIGEQRRIVAKLNELLDSTSQLERTISTP